MGPHIDSNLQLCALQQLCQAFLVGHSLCGGAGSGGARAALLPLLRSTSVPLALGVLVDGL